jgi:tight adherence protein B
VSRRGKALIAAAAVLVTVFGTTGSARADVQTVRIRSVDQKAFPQVKVTVAVGSEASVSAADIRISEDGRRVIPRSVESLEQVGRKIDIVLAIDVSDSVKGTPLATALAAARDFVGRLPAGVRVGLETFSRTPTVLRNLTDDHAGVLAALGPMDTHLGTALYDAVAAAAGMFSQDSQRNIVLFTDGSNTTRTGTLEAAIAAAKNARATVFTVGLQSRELDPDVLRDIAKQTGGAYSTATEESLASIYQELASELSHQFEVTYRSTSDRGRQVSISVSVAGVEDTALVLTPEARRLPSSGGASRVPAVEGTWGLLVALALCFLAVFVLLVVVLGVSARNRRERDLARRMGADELSLPSEEAAERSEAGLGNWIPEPVAAVAERIAEAGGFAKSLDRRLERAGLLLSSGEFVAANSMTALLGLLVGGLALRSPLFALILLVVGAVAPSVLLSIAIARRTSRLHGQLADVVTILASSLRAGHSFSQALEVASREVAEPAGPEFQRVVAEVRLGRPVEQALNAMAVRVGSEDFKWAVLAVNIQREVGGNLAEVLDIVADTLREREVLRRQVMVLSAEGRLSVKILIALPFLIGLYIAKVNPGYMDLLFSTRLGWVFTGTGAALMVLGIIWARKLVKIDV